MQVTVVTTDDLRREELNASKILKLEVQVGETVFSIRERDGELCTSIEGQIVVRPIGANLLSLSASSSAAPEGKGRSLLLGDLGVSVRTINCLHNAGYTSVAQVSGKSYNELAQIPNLTVRGVNELKKALAAHGLAVK